MQDDKTKLKLLVEMVKALSERVDFLSQMTGVSKATRDYLSNVDMELKNKIKDIEKDIE